MPFTAGKSHILMQCWSNFSTDVDKNGLNNNRDWDEEEEQVFIATAKGRNGPERPLHPSTCDKRKVPTN